MLALQFLNKQSNIFVSLDEILGGKNPYNP